MFYIVFMPWMAMELEQRGFELKEIGKNHKKPELNVYKFLDTPELHKTIAEILQKRHKT